MKNVVVLLAIAGLLGLAGTASAQTKIGYISVENVLSLMPEVSKFDSILSSYQADSINPQYASLIQTYQYKDSMYKDTLKPPPPAVKKQLEEELPQLINTIQNWQQIVNQAMEAKQNELLAPLYRKIYEAIRAVAKEKGYTHVLNKESLLVAPDADDMVAAVAAKLKLSLPKPAAAGAPVR
ncbi:MAG: OmpH family outer membrane protein [Sphingomonadales bacterium]|nr:OmpH family outer membrane protein [Sphingomonadales bacterium]